jgi:uncharacterized protein (TIGR00159 family)
LLAHIITGFIDIRLLDILDIFLVAILLYLLYNLLKGTVAINIFFGIVAIFLIWKVVDALEMQLLSEILGAFISVGFIALIIIFQPEIRQFLLALGKPGFISKRRRKFLFWWLDEKGAETVDIDKVVKACQNMSNIKQGALILITRRNELNQVIDTGEIVDATISVELLENIFFKNSPLHDGAVVISGNRIEAAKCILPVSKSLTLAGNVGLRHRAAVGVTEISDAIAIIVSEETGKLAVAIAGKLKRNLQPAELQDLLEIELGYGQENSR